jgi:hypothetical protein
MGFTTAMFMFIGGVIYDGRVEEVKKGVITIGAYVGMLIWVTLLRVNNRISTSGNFANLSKENASMAFAGIVTILFITFACMFGIILGVSILKYEKQMREFGTLMKEYIKNLLKY